MRTTFNLAHAQYRSNNWWKQICQLWPHHGTPLRTLRSAIGFFRARVRAKTGKTQQSSWPMRGDGQPFGDGLS